MVHKVIVVTGANRGLGFEFISQLTASPQPVHHYFTAEHNCTEYTVIALVRQSNPEQLDTKWQHVRDVMDKVNTAAKTDNTIIPRHLVVLGECDVTVDSSVEMVLNYVTEHFKRIDLLICNAGIIEPTPGTDISSITTNDDDYILKMFKTNTIAPIVMTNKLMPLLNAAAGVDSTTTTAPTFDSTVDPGLNSTTHLPNPEQTAQVAFISSNMGSIGFTNASLSPTYRATKASLNMYVRQLALQYPMVSFLPIHPGWCQTDMGSRGGRTPPQTSTEGVAGCLVQMDKHTHRQDSGAKLYSYDGSELLW